MPELDLPAARRAVDPHVLRTPLLPSFPLGEALGTSVHLKLENMQVTGSFKVRGAACRLGALSSRERARGVVACSSGNHGRAVAHMARLLEIPATICVPRWVDRVKLDAIRAEGADAVLAGESYDEAEGEAFRIRDERDGVFVHPFDDLRVLAGQATLGQEIVQALPRVRTLLVPLSGGGLIAGVAWAARQARPDLRVVAVSALRASVMLESLRAGRPVSLPEEETIASALSGGIGQENRWTFSMVERLVDDHVTVTEDEIRHGVAWAFRRVGTVVEGGGAVALAALLSGRIIVQDDGRPGTGPGAGFQDTASARVPRGPVVAILSGGNLAMDRLAEILNGSS